MPYPDFRKSAEVLDFRRLGKQRLEARQLLAALRGKSRGWRNHPAAIMWRGHERALTEYMNACIKEWKRRGYNNTMRIYPVRGVAKYPPWLGSRSFHASHRSNLLRKDPGYYSRFGWTEPDDLEYVWPCAQG